MEQHGTLPMSPPRSPSWLLTGFPSIPSDIQNTQPTPQKRQSLRLRPEDILEDAEPSSPLNLTSKPATPPVTSKMSIFNLFSRPNVERQRGYAEPDIDVAPTKNTLTSKSELIIRVQPESPPATPARPASVLSGKTMVTKWTKWKPKPRQQPSPSKERRPGSFEPLPLFQAYPQSIQDGTLEVSSISVEALNKAKSKGTVPNNTLGENAAGDRDSTETKRASAMKYIANGSAVSLDLPKKVFVLVTSGYLLQYAEKGTSDRLPEKVLHLGKDSAAVACDLVPGKHYVLQISQTVDQDGIIVANTGSILSRLGIRSAAAKRMTSNLVLVLPNAKEMDSWMSAVRQEIEALGGKKCQLASVKPASKNGEPSATDLKKTPSQSHRYQIKRNPSKVASVISPIATQIPLSPMHLEFDRFERSPIDNVESDASRPNQYETDSREHARLPVELSVFQPTPPTVVVEEPEIEKSNDIPSESAYVSPAKQTVLAPTWSVRSSSKVAVSSTATNSPQANPEQPQESSMVSGSSNATTPASFSSHNFSRKAPPAPLTLHTQVVPARRSVVDESPIIPNYALLSEGMSARLANAYNERNSSTIIPARHRHDSKVTNTPTTSVAKSTESQSESQDSTPNLSPPTIVDSYLASSPRISFPNPSSTASVEIDRARKVASFSLPLRVNPTAIHGSLSNGNVRRHSRMDETGSTGESRVGYALTPPSDSSGSESYTFLQPATPSPTPSPSSDGHKHSLSNSPPARLSLFPTARPTPTMMPNGSFKRSSAGSLRHAYSQPVMNSGALRRPNSMQIRADHAPFLTSVRNSTGSADSRISATTVPIRGMKPSRPTSNSTSLPRQHSSTMEEFKALRFDTPTLDEEVDLAMPLPVEKSAPPMNKTRSRNSVRKSLKSRSSLPDLDFGIPVIGLGPPAPPPQAPLPAPPLASRTTSPTPLSHENGSIDSVAGLGITVS